MSLSTPVELNLVVAIPVDVISIQLCTLEIVDVQAIQSL
jgi:hypothetical protein